MPSNHKIIIQNGYSLTTKFFVYQQPATIANSGAVCSVTSTSLGTGTLLPHAQSGTNLVFQFSPQVLVAAYSNQTTTKMNRIAPTLAWETQSSLDASWPISLTPPSPTPAVNNNTVLSPQPLGLTQPTPDAKVPPGNFGIEVPSYAPMGGVDLFCGTAVNDEGGGIILSSYITPPPASHIFCAPIAKYYIKVGDYDAGNVITFSTDNAAPCDFTNDLSTCNVAYNADGSFSVTRH